jgi:hypothetical protein
MPRAAATTSLTGSRSKPSIPTTTDLTLSNRLRREGLTSPDGPCMGLSCVRALQIGLSPTLSQSRLSVEGRRFSPTRPSRTRLLISRPSFKRACPTDRPRPLPHEVQQQYLSFRHRRRGGSASPSRPRSTISCGRTTSGSLRPRQQRSPIQLPPADAHVAVGPSYRRQLTSRAA